MKAPGSIYLLGAAAVLTSIGLVAVIRSQRPPSPGDDGDAPGPSPTPAPDTDDARRQAVIAAARAELGHVGGDKYFAEEHPDYLGKSKDWCGIFALRSLHQAGLALDRHWIDGKGFILTGVHPLPPTTNPKPGDLIYIDQPFQHEGIVESIDGDMVHTVDGNTRNTVATHARPRSTITLFYSIAPLLREVGLVA